MLSKEAYIKLSLEYNLFWLRIMKEHAIFIEGAILPPEKQLALQANQFKLQFENLLANTIRLANRSVSNDSLRSGQFFTRFTEEAERLTQQFTGIQINKNLTLKEYDIEPMNSHIAMPERKEQEVALLNQSILSHMNAFAQFKAKLLNDQVSCRIFTLMYTADLDHVLREANRYIEILSRLQSRDDSLKQNYHGFWTRNMADHAKSMRGLFDPTETAYFNEADQFAKIFDALLQHEKTASANTYPTAYSALNETKAISEFKADTTRGLIQCKVKAIMSPLYTDHILREANYYIYLMQV